MLRHLHVKSIILPRQARDKHRKTPKKEALLQVTARVYPMADDSEGAVLTLAVPAGAPNPTEVRAAAWEMGATML